jgi:hypothetical protein
MAVTTLTFTMRNEGFRSQYVAPYSKAVLITVVLDEARCIVAMVVLGIPLTGCKDIGAPKRFPLLSGAGARNAPDGD